MTKGHKSSALSDPSFKGKPRGVFWQAQISNERIFPIGKVLFCASCHYIMGIM